MAQVVLLPFINPRVGLLMPTSITFKVVTIPLTLTVLSVHLKPFRIMCKSLLCIDLPDKFSWKNPEHIRKAAIAFGIFEMLTQLLIAPLLVPLPLSRPNPLMGKLTSLGVTDVPRVAYTLATLLLLPRVVTNFGESFLNIKDTGTSKLSSEIMLLGSFAVAVLLRDGATPLDLAIPAVLTTLTFAMPQFDKLSRFMFNAEFPKFEWKRDSMVLASVIYSTWLAMMLAYGDYLPVLKQFNDTVRRLISGNADTRFIKKLIEFSLLCLIPTVIRRHSKKGDEDIGYSSGFIVALLAKSMIPELRMPGTRII
jgi:hypothetical protein